MTNEKRNLFATLGLVAEETVATEAVNTEPEVELTALESIDAELKDLADIDLLNSEYEQASYESVISDLELLNQVLAYKSIKTYGLEDAALESISNEFGIATEGIKEMAKKGVKGLGALIKKLITAIKQLLGLAKTEEKVIKSLEYKIKEAGLSSAELEVSDEDYRKYVELYVKLDYLNTNINPETGKIEKLADVPMPKDIKLLSDKSINLISDKIRPALMEHNQLYKENEYEQANTKYKEAIVYLLKFTINPIVSEEVKTLTVPDNFKIGPALTQLSKMYSKYATPNKNFDDIIKSLEKLKENMETNSSKYKLFSTLIKSTSILKKFKQSTLKELVMLCGKYLNKAKTEKTA